MKRSIQAHVTQTPDPAAQLRQAYQLIDPAFAAKSRGQLQIAGILKKNPYDSEWLVAQGAFRIKRTESACWRVKITVKGRKSPECRDIWKRLRKLHPPGKPAGGPRLIDSLCALSWCAVPPDHNQ